jgi:phosphoribosylamine--glycine ligase
MGDPECQTILPKLKSDLLEIFLACCNQKLDEIELKWSNKKSLCIVLCSKGYPDNYKKNILINNLDRVKNNDNEYTYHAGTVQRQSGIYSIGGRVLNFVCLSDEFFNARMKIFNSINSLNWSSGFYRKDIGYKVIDECE